MKLKFVKMGINGEGIAYIDQKPVFVEGVYPPDFEYLQENYGLQVNTDDYYVVYEAFASNIPPTIHVLEK